MASLILKRGLERAAALFEMDLPAETIADWQDKAKRIGENLHRLFDPNVGGFVGATKVGRGFDVWGNGLAWPLATRAQRDVIATTFTKHRADIFAFGCTRQTPYPDGWPGTTAKGYQNQGFWATGKPGGPADCLGSLSMPLMGTRSILTGRPLMDDL